MHKRGTPASRFSYSPDSTRTSSPTFSWTVIRRSTVWASWAGVWPAWMAAVSHGHWVVWPGRPPGTEPGRVVRVRAWAAPAGVAAPATRVEVRVIPTMRAVHDADRRGLGRFRRGSEGSGWVRFTGGPKIAIAPAPAVADRVPGRKAPRDDRTGASWQEVIL